MKKTKVNMSAPCMGCRYSEIETGKEFVCNRPDQTKRAVMSALMDAVFDGVMTCNEPRPTATKARPRK